MKINLDQIAEYSAAQIAESVRSGSTKAVDVLKAMRQNAEKSQSLNCVVQFLDDYAFPKAEWIDDQIAKGAVFNSEEYPLIGVPISVKDCFEVEGYENTIGLDRFKGVINKKTHPLIALLEKSGAIPFCTTHVCQFMGTLESTNSHGATYNPYNSKFTSGGSSSGEGALIGSDGSILGVGSDIGGSIRVPSAFCGIYGLKPTPKRWIEGGKRNVSTGQEGILATTDPMAKHVKDLDLSLKAVLDKKPWEVSTWVLPLPYRQVELPKKLRIGYYVSDGKFPVSPACERAVMMAVDALHAAGHEVFPYHEPAIRSSASMYLKFTGLDKSHPKLQALQSHEKLTPENCRALSIHRLPKFATWLLTGILKYIMGEKEMADIIWSFAKSDIHTHFQLNDERAKLEQEHFEAWNNAAAEDGSPMDFVICPISPIPPFPHNTFDQLFFAYGYSFIYNLLGNTTGVVPVTRVNREIDAIDNLDKWLKEKLPSDYNDGLFRQKQVYSHYDVDQMHGLPIAIQIVGRKYEEEKVVKGMALIDQVLKQHNQADKYKPYAEYHNQM